MPKIPTEIRARIRKLLLENGTKRCHRQLAVCDPNAAERLAPGDTQRIARALEVFEATGTPISDWQAAAPSGPDPSWRFSSILIAPPREAMNAAIDHRFDTMIDAGALDEVRAVAHLDDTLPGLKALGVPGLRRHLAGEISLEKAAEDSKTSTRQFAKRQMTWFRNQIIADKTINTQYMQSFRDKIFSFIRNNVLTDSD